MNTNYLQAISALLLSTSPEKAVCRIAELAVSSRFSGQQRLALSAVLHLGLPENISVELINTCFERMLSPKSPTAVQALSMKLLFAFCQREPDFKQELKACLSSVDIENYSVGFKTVRKNILRELGEGGKGRCR